MNNENDKTICHCAEAFYDAGKRRLRFPKPEFHQYHDCDYVRQRNALIPEAERAATHITKDEAGKEVVHFSTRVFSDTMDELWRKKAKGNGSASLMQEAEDIMRNIAGFLP